MLLLLAQLHLPEETSLVVVSLWLLCWGWWRLKVTRAAASRHVLNEVHRLRIVLNYVLGLR